MRCGRALSQESNLGVRAEARAIGLGIEHRAAGDSVLFRGIAQNESIADKSKNRWLQPQLSNSALPRRERTSIQKRDLRSNAACSKMNLNGTAVLHWTRCRRISVHAR